MSHDTIIPHRTKENKIYTTSFEESPPKSTRLKICNACLSPKIKVATPAPDFAHLIPVFNAIAVQYRVELPPGLELLDTVVKQLRQGGGLGN